MASLHASLHHAKIKSIDEILAVQSETGASSFDEKTDKTFEELALKRIAERKAEHGGQ